MSDALLTAIVGLDLRIRLYLLLGRGTFGEVARIGSRSAYAQPDHSP